MVVTAAVVVVGAVDLATAQVITQQVYGNTVTIGGGTFGSAVATCPAAEVATGGGYVATGFGVVTGSVSTTSGNGWSVGFNTFGTSGSMTVTPFAVCALGIQLPQIP